jgi:hypothetical protein
MKPAKQDGNAGTAIIKTISPFMSWVCCRNDIQYYIAANKQQGSGWYLDSHPTREGPCVLWEFAYFVIKLPKTGRRANLQEVKNNKTLYQNMPSKTWVLQLPWTHQQVRKITMTMRWFNSECMSGDKKLNGILHILDKLQAKPVYGESITDL